MRMLCGEHHRFVTERNLWVFLNELFYDTAFDRRADKTDFCADECECCVVVRIVNNEGPRVEWRFDLFDSIVVYAITHHADIGYEASDIGFR